MIWASLTLLATKSYFTCVHECNLGSWGTQVLSVCNTVLG
jgi:hypothetical protein